MCAFMFSILACIFQITKQIFQKANPQMCGHFATGETADATLLFETAKGGQQILHFITTNLT